jgi:hypothetical protein
MEATLFLQLRVSLRFFAPGDLTQAMVEDLVARLRTREPAPYRHWFTTAARDECDLWWELETTDVVEATEKTKAIFQTNLVPALATLGGALQPVRFVVYAKRRSPSGQSLGLVRPRRIVWRAFDNGVTGQGLPRSMGALGANGGSGRQTPSATL